jgi:hypothetical protein
MKIIIIIIFAFLFYSSCSTGGRKLIKSPKFETPTKDITLGTDSTSSNSFKNNDDFNDIQPDRITMSSSEGDAPKPSNIEKPPLKIIEVKNTKVIKNNTNLSEGRIVYKIPNIMKIRSTYKVFVRISKSKSTLSIYDSLSGEVKTSILPITETMEAKLIDLSPKDNKCFDIQEQNDGVQLVENGDTYTEWSWGVTPIRLVNSKLEIVISVIRDGNKKDIVYEDTVEVERDIREQILFFLKKYWQFLMTSMIIPFVVWFYKNIKEKKEKNKSEDSNNQNIKK